MKSPPHPKATIAFTNDVKDEDISGVGGTTDKVDRGDHAHRRALNLHGDRTNTGPNFPDSRTRQQLDKLLNAAGWRVGDEIVPRHGFNPRQAERHCHFRHQRKYDHARQQAGVAFGKITFDVDERGDRHDHTQYQASGIGRRGTILLRRARDGDEQ